MGSTKFNRCPIIKNGITIAGFLNGKIATLSRFATLASSSKENPAKPAMSSRKSLRSRRKIIVLGGTKTRQSQEPGKKRYCGGVTRMDIEEVWYPRQHG